MKPLKSILLVFCSVALLQATGVYVTPRILTELKETPKATADVTGMAKAGTLWIVRSVVPDTASGSDWYLIHEKDGSQEGFVLSSILDFIEEEGKAQAIVQSENFEKQDKKRRLTAITAHPEWPRRILSAIRTGAICLKMTGDQLEATWNKPYCKTKGFMIGYGDVKIIFYRPDNPIAVMMKNNEVVGWSEKEKE